MAPLLVFVSFLAIYSPVHAAKKKPKDFFTLCKRSDPELSKCALNSVVKAKNLISKGIPELNLHSIDPLLIPRMEMSQGRKNFKLDVMISNMTLSGVGDTEILDVEVSKGLREVNITSFVALNEVETDYKMSGKILVMPVQGNGKSKIILENIKSQTNVQFEFFDKKGVEYFKCKSLRFVMEPSMVKLNFTNLFNGDKALGDNANKFFNENWKEAYNAIKELPEEGFAQVLKEYINRSLLKYPAKDWFLD